LRGNMPNLNLYISEDDYRIIDDVAQKNKKKTATVGREWLEERCALERGRGKP